MANNIDDVVTSAGSASHRTEIQKWIHILFLCQTVTLLKGILGVLIGLGSLNVWVSRAVSAVTIVAFFKLAAVNDRYRKAAIFTVVSLVGGIVSALMGQNALLLALSVCTIIASYQELNAHSELTETMDAKLSRRWHSLFYLELFVGVLAGALGMIPIMIAVFAGADADVISKISTLCSTVVSLFLALLRFLYLKKTQELFRQ